MTSPKNISRDFGLTKNLKLKQILFFIGIVLSYYIFLYLNGFFQIGWLSDSYEDMYFAVNTTVVNIFKGEIYYGRYRPLLFLILKLLNYLNSLLGAEYDNFIFFSILNSLLYLVSGIIIYKLLRLFSVNSVISILASSIVLFYPNNIHNLAWSAAFFETISLIIYLLSLYFTVILVKEKKFYLIPIIFLLLILGILLKETNLTIPFISILFILLLGYDLKGKGTRILFAAELIILSIYAALKFFVLKHPLQDVATINFANAYNLILKVYLSYFVPGDYIEIIQKVYSYNILVIGYIAALGIILVFIFIKHGLNKNVYILLLMSIIMVSPNIYAGYLRPQLIFIPFSIVFTGIVFFLNKKVKNTYTVIILTVFLCIFVSLSAMNIRDWKNTYTVMKSKLGIIIANEHNFSGNDAIIGNTSRIKQCFLFDNPTFIYNYWKYKQISFKDTINSYLPTVSVGGFNNNIPITYNSSKDSLVLSVNPEDGYFADDEHNKQGSDEYEIKNFGKIKILERNRLKKIIKILVLLYIKDLNIYYINDSKLTNINHL